MADPRPPPIVGARHASPPPLKVDLRADLDLPRSAVHGVVNRHFSQELACSDVARALVPAAVPPGPGTLADASFDTVSQPRTRVEMSLRTPDVA